MDSDEEERVRQQMKRDAAEFQSFYDHAKQDYVFSLEDIPIAIKRIQLEEKLEQEKLSLESEANLLNGKVDITRKYLPPEAIESSLEVG